MTHPWRTTTRTARAHAPRTHSPCCRARVVAGRCSECAKPASWRARLTEAEAAEIAARLALSALPKPELSAEARARHLAALYGENYD